ncbi:MAG TPA: response regulator [Chitinophagaceae bacterium]|nr:response regulator [Chitinophagaceae bacterium]
MIRNLLLIDDDEDEINIFTEALHTAGIPANCRWVKNAISARNVSPMPDIIFLDINMPRLDGFECLADIKKCPTLFAVPVILYSTGMNNSMREKGLSSGAAGCIAKTYSIYDLSNTLKNLFCNFGLPFKN